MRRLVLLLLLFGCGPERSFDAVDPALFEATPSYATDVAPLMDRYCEACHASDGLRAGGVELDLYENLYSARVKNVCVAIEPELLDRYATELLAERVKQDDGPCSDWEPYSMPTGAKLRLTPSEQVVFVRWVVTGANP